MNISSVCQETEYRKGILLIIQGGEFRYIDHLSYPLIWETLLSRSVPRAESNTFSCLKILIQVNKES